VQRDERRPLSPPSIAGESVSPVDRSRDGITEELLDDTARLGAGRAPDSSAALASSDPLIAGLGDSGPPVFGAGDQAGRKRIGDRVFKLLSASSATIVVLLVVLIGTFLLVRSIPSIVNDKDNFFTSTNWVPAAGNLHFGIAALVYVTVVISIIAMIVAVPIAVGVALFITQYAPRPIVKPVGYVIDLLAAIPSIVYGIWGAFVLTPELEPVQRAFSHIPIPFFDLKQNSGTIFDGAVVLAVMILPIITAISRDVFERTPRDNVEAALALGATKWEMIRMSVLPHGRAGVVSGSMLGLGRALGETIAVYLIVRTTSPPFISSIFNGGSTVASKIAGDSSEFNNPQSTGAYIAAGLVLFVLTFVVNAAARAIVNRKKDFV
jgi:phosphate transport system permease protein